MIERLIILALIATLHLAINWPAPFPRPKPKDPKQEEFDKWVKDQQRNLPEDESKDGGIIDIFWWLRR